MPAVAVAALAALAAHAVPSAPALAASGTDCSHRRCCRCRWCWPWSWWSFGASSLLLRQPTPTWPKRRKRPCRTDGGTIAPGRPTTRRCCRRRDAWSAARWSWSVLVLGSVLVGRQQRWCCFAVGTRRSGRRMSQNDRRGERR